MTKMVYKAVYDGMGIYPTEFHSLVTLLNNRLYCHPTIDLIYRIGKITRPKIDGSPIFAFDCLKNLEYFCPIRTHVSVLKCEYKPYAKVFTYISASLTEQSILDAWNQLASDTWEVPPLGTVFCEWVKPIGMER